MRYSIFFISYKLILLLGIMSWANSSAMAQQIYVTEWKSDADVIVYVEKQWKSDADLIVYQTEWKSDAKDGQWYLTKWKTDADKQVYFTKWKSDADVIIYYTEWKSDAGWKNEDEKSFFE